jgi:quinol monooxygenase YgiN
VIIEYIRYAIPADRADAFKTAYRAASRALDASEHCQAYELSRGVEQPENWILRIEWDSLEGHEQGFRSSPDFGLFFQAVGPYFDDIQEMKHYQATPIAERTAAGRPVGS